ncbi:MAG: Ig-like domain-containing protein [Oscillospiraceae bacterium]
MSIKSKLITKKIATLLIVLLLVVLPIMSNIGVIEAATPPIVSITNPLEDKIVSQNQEIIAEAQVSDISNVSKVVFYEWYKPGMQCKKIGEDTAYPYSVSYIPSYYSNMCGYSSNYITAIAITKDNQEIMSEYRKYYVFQKGTLAPIPNLSVAKWKDNKKAAYSPTYDDNYLIESQKQINVLHKKNIISNSERNIKGTIFWDTAGGNWDELNKSILSDDVLTMGAHTVTHPYDFSALSLADMDTQLADSQNAIYNNTGKMPLTHAYPRYILNDTIINKVQKYYIAARWGSDSGNNLDGSKVDPSDLAVGINDYNTTDYYKIKAMCPAISTPSSTFDKWLDDAIAKQGWLVTSMHGLKSLHPYSWKVQDDSQLNTHYDYVKTKAVAGSVWNDTFENVSMYLRERNAAILKNTSTEDVLQYKYFLSVNDTMLAQHLQQYLNFPLTLKFKLPDGWTYINVTQDSNNIATAITSETDGLYVIFDAVPQDGEIIITKGN